jgi:hypothetical protein
VGKIDDIVGNLVDSPSDFFSRSQVQLDSFAGAALKMLITVALGWTAGFSCAGKLEQAIDATMIPRRSE